VVKNNQAWFAHVGDSRIYLVRGDDIRQITEDHSLVASMVREGLLTAKEAETHPRRNVLQRSMGVTEEVEIDVNGPFDVKQDDIFILCSDGLHGLVKELELKEIAALPIDEAATEYVRRVLSRVPLADAGEVTLVDADETLADNPLDETQRDTAKISALIDELPDQAPEENDSDLTAPGEPSVEAASPATPNVSIETPIAVNPAMDKTIETPIVAVGKQAPRGPLLKWVLIVILALGAAGGWFYWNHQSGRASKTTVPSNP